MNFALNDSTVIYVAAPAKVASGGSELLHQLAYHLRVDLGFKAYMYYLGGDLHDPVHPEYKSYGNPFVKQIVDDRNNILIVPETMDGVTSLAYFRNILKMIWWLSVDNFPISYMFSRGLRVRPLRYIHLFFLVNKIARRIFGTEVVDLIDTIHNFVDDKALVLRAFQELNVKHVDMHLCQSYYAMNFLNKLSINNVAYLSDYLNIEFLTHIVDNREKSNLVVFNPRKGAASFICKIMSCLPDISFVPLQNMARSEVINLFKRAKVYIDFGIHPGRDRPPREAALLGCCVIVGERGAAANSFDVRIPNKYKFKVDKRTIPRVVETVENCLKNYEVVYHDFDEYREHIKSERDRFLKDLVAIFRKGARV